MPWPTRIIIDSAALLHNLGQVRKAAPHQQIIAMVKANAYGCGLKAVTPVLEGRVDAFGVARIEEAMCIRSMGSRTLCVLFQGVWTAEALVWASNNHCACVLNQPLQVQMLLDTPLPKPLPVWLKVDTGMHRLGFEPNELAKVVEALQACAWVDKHMGLMTHFACADEPLREKNNQQISIFNEINAISKRSMANSAAILSNAKTHADVVRPGIMLYGVSPFAQQRGLDWNLRPVMRFISAVSAIHHLPAGASVGYGATWHTDKPSIIGVVAAGYGDGYPRHVHGAYVGIRGQKAPIVGRVSMDMLTVDLTHIPETQIGDEVELWGSHIFVEEVAHAAGTIAYELLCQVTERVRAA